MTSYDVDKENGIRYGVISQNSIDLNCMDEFEYDYGEPTCPNCGNAVTDSAETEPDADWNDGRDYACAECESCYWSESVYSEEALGWDYEGDGYSLTDCLDTDIFVLASPYYTYACFCSPCVPGACSLDSPMEPDAGVKCYALGHEWFDTRKAPYRIWKVSDDSEVEGGKA